MGMKPTEPTEGYSGDPALRPTSPPPPRKKPVIVPVESTLAFYAMQNKQLLLAMDGLWGYACTGASCTDIDTTEQHQFVTARRFLEPLWEQYRQESQRRKKEEFSDGFEVQESC